MKEIGENMGRNSIKSVAQIEKLLDDPWAVDLQELWEQSLHNPDPDKKKVLYAFYSYALAKQQDELLKNKRFII